MRNHAVVFFFAASGVAMMVAEVRSTRNCCQHGQVTATAGAGYVKGVRLFCNGPLITGKKLNLAPNKGFA